MFKSSDLLGIFQCMTYLYKSWRWNEQRNVKMTWCSTALEHQMPLPGGVHLTGQCILNGILQNVKMTLCSTPLGHQMPLPGGTSAFLTHLLFYVLLHRGLFYKRLIKAFIQILNISQYLQLSSINCAVVPHIFH